MYPALYRMEAKGWIELEWAQTENNRRAKYYRLTRTRRERLVVEREDWDRLAALVTKVLETP